MEDDRVISIQNHSILTGANYATWKVRTKTYLDGRRLWRLVEKDVSELVAVHASAPDDSLAVRKRKEEAKELLLEQDAKCRDAMMSRVSDTVLSNIANCPSSRNIWCALAERYGAMTLSSHMVLTKQYRDVVYNPSTEKFDSYCARFDNIVSGLKEYGEAMEDVRVISHFLWSLPSAYLPVVTSMQVAADQAGVTLTLAFVKTKIDQFEKTRENARQLKEKQGSSSVGSAFTSAAARGGHQSPGCFNCKRTNHRYDQCFAEGGGAYRGGRGSISRGRGRGGHHPYHRGNFNFNRGMDRGRGRGGFRGRGDFSNRGGRGRGRGVNKQETAAMAALADGPDEHISYAFMSSGFETVSENAVRFTGAHEALISTQSSLFIKLILDSGASSHMVRSDVPVSKLKRLSTPTKIQIAKTENYLYAHAKGTLVCELTTNGTTRRFEIEVLVVESLAHNLLSISKLEKQGNKIIFWNGECTINCDGVDLAKAKRTPRNLYELNAELLPAELRETSLLCLSKELWHKRLGHMGKTNLGILPKLVNGMEVAKGEVPFCETCVKGSQEEDPFHGTRPRTSRPLERIHSDVCGPVNPVALNGIKYIVTFVDDYSHFLVVYGLKSKSELYAKLVNYEAKATSRFGTKICSFRCDNGTEYINEKVLKFCEAKGIEMENTIVRTSPNNGVAERINRTLFNKMRHMLFGSKLNKTFWYEAISSAVYLLNRSPTRAVPEEKTPAELWFGVKPDLSRLRVFGCVAYALIHKEEREGKVAPRSKRCIMLGYCENGYRLWSISERKLIRARSVIFNEARNHFDDEQTFIFETEKDPPKLRIELADDSDYNSDNDGDNEPLINNNDQPIPDIPDDTPDDNIEIEEFVEEMVEEPRRGARVRVKPRHLEDYVQLAMLARFVSNIELNSEGGLPFLSALSCVTESELSVSPGSSEACYYSAMGQCLGLPTTFEEIGGRKDRDLWQAAIDEELLSLNENKTWEIVDCPVSKIPINSKWVFTVKQNGDGNVERYKARLVIKGCAQRKGLDYNETYAPVARLVSVRVFLCLVNKEKLFVEQLDVKNAFLNGILKEEIYMWPPEGLPVKGNKVCRLKKTLYGLKQAPMEWNHRFSEFVKQLEFKQCQADRCTYVRRGNGSVVYLLLYVDDFLMAGSDKQMLCNLKSKLMNEFRMRDMGSANYFLGIKITRSENGMFLSQENYVNKILDKYTEVHMNPCVTPLDVRPVYPIAGKPCIVGKEPYREAIGSLMYACMSTRPDLCTAVNFYSQFQTNATEDQWKGIKRIFRYLRGCPRLGLWYKANSYVPLVLYVDADFANDPSRKSVSGFVIEMFGDSVLWGTRKQTSVALSTTEAEFVALATAVCELLWLKQLLTELGVKFSGSIPIFEDNSACILASSKWETKRLKHIDVKYNFVKDLCHNKIISVNHIPTGEQKADIMTKGLNAEFFTKHRTNLGMCEQ